MKKYFLISILLLAALLRFYKLGSNPPSLYWDEASLGYNAYSILKTGHDEHGKFMPKTNFAAFGDYKPPLYIYTAVPSIAIFGPNEFGIRFPSAFFGVLTVMLAYLIAKELFDDENTALISSLFLAISPWHIQLSRAAFEGNLALFFSSLGILFFIKFAKSKPYYIFASAASFLAAIYTFTGQRLFVPFILVVLALQFKKQVILHFKYVLLAGLIAFVFFWPLFKFATQTLEGRLRFNEVSIFKDLEPIERARRYQEEDHFSKISALVNNRRVYYTEEYMKHYFDAFNPTFLFIRGDTNPRFSNQETGELYLVDLFLIILGVYYLFAKKQKYRLLILGWLLVSPLGPAVARETPHALRMIHILPTFQLIAAYGLLTLYRSIKFKKALSILTIGALFVSLCYFLEVYYIHWPRNYSTQWQYGYKEAVEATKPLYDDADQIIVAKDYGRPYIYFLLYLKYDPNKYLQTAQVVRDQYYFLDVNSFDKYHFVDSLANVQETQQTIYVLPPSKTPPRTDILKEIYDLKGNKIFEISKPKPPLEL